MADHSNSRRISIFRTGSFLENAQTGAQEFLSMSKKSIGTYFAGNLGSSVGTGLSFEEIDVIMPLLIDIPKDDRSFREGVTKFFSNISTKIPWQTGKEFEIGLLLDNGKPVTFVDELGKKNLPINLQDWVRYRHALKHPHVSPSKSAALGNMLAEYYIFDQSTVNTENAAAAKIADEAMTLYLTIKKDPEKVDAMLTILGVDIRAYHGLDADDLKLEKLRYLASGDEKVGGDPAKFIKVHTEKHFDERFLIQKMVNTGVVRKIGNQYVENETGSILGHTIEEVVYYLLDKANSDKVSFLKAKTQEAMKKKIDVARNTKKTTLRA